MNTQFMHLVKNQSPANFAMVMSTGIVSIALHLLEYPHAALGLFFVNIFMWLVLACTYTLRAVVYPRAFFDDFADHNKGPGYLTIVAGTCILGNQFALFCGDYLTAQALLLLSLILWFLCLWGIFFALFTRPDKPSVDHGINGAWLVATVSTQALVILGVICIGHTAWDTDTVFVLLVALFGLGFMLYIIMITMIFYRFCYKSLSAAQLSPTFWINAGAMAITTLAGAELILHAPLSPFVTHVLPFLYGTTLMAWATATWWIIMLILLGFWRHIGQKFPFNYEAGYWGMVFPMGMYTACTYTLAEALDLPSLLVVPESFIGVALIAWLTTTYGMCAMLIRRLGEKN
ncbi:MAG: tellurite resistance/C4-dicarboxylate transporter family protein [Desulfovibrionaceae bacterium]